MLRSRPVWQPPLKSVKGVHMGLQCLFSGLNEVLELDVGLWRLWYDDVWWRCCVSTCNSCAINMVQLCTAATTKWIAGLPPDGPPWSNLVATGRTASASRCEQSSRQSKCTAKHYGIEMPMEHYVTSSNFVRWNVDTLAISGYRRRPSQHFFHVCSIAVLSLRNLWSFRGQASNPVDLWPCTGAAVPCVARRIRLPREMQTAGKPAGTDGRFGYGPKISKMGTFKQRIMVYQCLSWFPKEKDQQPICSLEWLCDWLWLTFWPVGP